MTLSIIGPVGINVFTNFELPRYKQPSRYV